MKIFRTKSSSEMRLIFILMNWLIDKIVAFGIQKMSNCWKIYIHTNSHSQITVWYEFRIGGLSSNHSSSKMRLIGRIIIVNGARYRDTTIQFFMPKLQDMDMDDMLDDSFNKTIQFEKQFIYCTSYFPFLIRIGRPDRAI